MKACNSNKSIWLVALVLALSSDISAAPPIPSTIQFTNRNQFKIPFSYNPEEFGGRGVRQIRLYVSRNRGRSWEQADSVAPTAGTKAGKFAFRATEDGEYWFLVRTLDSKNQLQPDLSVNDPGLKVIVDTEPPHLELKLDSPGPGKVRLAWNASDEHLDPTQLRLEYLQPGAGEWQDVTIVPKANGKTEWRVDQGGVVAVRGSITDQAKNPANEQVQVRVAAATQSVPRPGVPESRQPVAGPGRDSHENLALSMPDRFPASGLAPPDDNDLEETFAERRTWSPGRPPATLSKDTGSRKGNLVSHKGDDKLADVPEPPAEPAQSSPQRTNPAGKKRVVDSRKFQIGYNLEGVGPSGVSSVDLYITDDNGATWYHYGTDDDNVSPILVEVPSEGTYGFALGVRSGAGLASDPPQNGDLPSIVVVVDQSPPAVELLSVQQGLGKNLNKLMITWKCEDGSLSDRPISLAYATSAQGPWTAIAGPIENTGSYVWSFGAGIPAKFFVRIEARDLAGHVQTVDTPQPIVIDLSRPTAQIIDVESSGVPR